MALAAASSIAFWISGQSGSAATQFARVDPNILSVIGEGRAQVTHK
jgi:hypothetical protein